MSFVYVCNKVIARFVLVDPFTLLPPCLPPPSLFPPFLLPSSLLISPSSLPCSLLREPGSPRTVTPCHTGRRGDVWAWSKPAFDGCTDWPGHGETRWGFETHQAVMGPSTRRQVSIYPRYPLSKTSSLEECCILISTSLLCSSTNATLATVAAVVAPGHYVQRFH